MKDQSSAYAMTGPHCA